MSRARLSWVLVLLSSVVSNPFRAHFSHVVDDESGSPSPRGDNNDDGAQQERPGTPSKLPREKGNRKKRRKMQEKYESQLKILLEQNDLQAYMAQGTKRTWFHQWKNEMCKFMEWCEETK